MKKKLFFCETCGYESTGWLGKCPACQAFNTFVQAPSGIQLKSSLPPAEVQPITQVQAPAAATSHLPFPEIERVLGGGIVPGQVILLGGEPGIGKSTLLLQLGFALASQGQKILYCSGEESPHQIQQRAKRLNALSENMLLLSSRSLADFLDRPLSEFALIFVDSLQTTIDLEIPQHAGSIVQVRACAERLQEKAKRAGVALLLVSHVTKEGGMAGPKLVEHIVDTVLYLEGDRTKEYRILRGVKNRFGPTNEIAILEMTAQGLAEVKNASSYFLQEQQAGAGSAIVAVQEGQHILFLEIQALVSRSPFQIPKRNTQGMPERRVSQIIAVLEKKAKLRLRDRDLFVNCVGGIRVTDTGADLGVALAIASSFLDKPLPRSTVLIGEIGLGGETRKVPHLEKRVQEAARLGFSQVILPAHAQVQGKIKTIKYRYLKEALALLQER